MPNYNVTFEDKDGKVIHPQTNQDQVLTPEGTLSDTIGQLPGLSTDHRDSLVGAINEIFEKGLSDEQRRLLEILLYWPNTPPGSEPPGEPDSDTPAFLAEIPKPWIATARDLRETSTPGISNRYARGDHAHRLPPVATPLRNGLMSAADKDKLDKLISGDPVFGGGGGGGGTPYNNLPLPLGEAHAGSSSNYSRGDHIHPQVPLATELRDGLMSADDKAKLNDWPIAPFENNPANIKVNQPTANVGSRNTIARGDHVHPTDLTRASLDLADLSRHGLLSKELYKKISEMGPNETPYDPPNPLPRMDGVGDHGIRVEYARGDHQHVTDFTRSPKPVTITQTSENTTLREGTETHTHYLGLNAVTNIKLDDMNQDTIKGRSHASGRGDPEDLTQRQVLKILDVINRVFVSTLDTTDFTTTPGAVAATDSIRQAIQKLAYRVTATEIVNSTGTVPRAWAPADVASATRSTPLTGMSLSNRSDVTATDTLLTAIGKLQAQAVYQRNITISPGNGLVGGGNLTANRAIAMRTPVAVTASSTNTPGTTTDGHTHQLTSADVSGGSIKGRNADDAGQTLDLTAAQVRTLLNVDLAASAGRVWVILNVPGTDGQVDPVPTDDKTKSFIIPTSGNFADVPHYWTGSDWRPIRAVWG